MTELERLGRRILRTPYQRLRRFDERWRQRAERRQLQTLEADAQEKFTIFAVPYKLHVGCGTVQLDGWVNIDREHSADNVVDVVWDITHRFPIPDETCVLIYSEHLLEHLTVEQGLFFLRECFRVLQPRGLVRVATPSLEDVVNQYLSERWREQDWLQWPEYQFIQTRAEMTNISFRWWGHQWLYDAEELERRLRQAGFQETRTAEWGKSACPGLRNLETRDETKLIYEAVK